MRDVLIHGVDLEEVWNAAILHVPELRAILEPFLADNAAPGNS